MIHSSKPLSSDADNLLVILKHLISCLPEGSASRLTESLSKEIKERLNSGVDFENASALQTMAEKAEPHLAPASPSPCKRAAAERKR
jgi:hypothetical protein